MLRLLLSVTCVTLLALGTGSMLADASSQARAHQEPRAEAQVTQGTPGGQSSAASHADRVPKIIFDTDFGGDADDLGALAMLHHLQAAGHCELLAIGNWTTERDARDAILAVNRFYGHASIPVGQRAGEPWAGDWHYSRAVLNALDERGEAGPQSPIRDVVSLYREVLAAQPEQSVQFITVGPLSNILDLLESGPDGHSPLAGRELVASRVSRFVIMGGKFPRGENEWNFDGDMPGVTAATLEQIDVPIIFSGYEVGEAIRTGPELARLPHHHPLPAGYLHFSGHAPWMKERFRGEILDNASFDQTAVLFENQNALPVQRLFRTAVELVVEHDRTEHGNLDSGSGIGEVVFCIVNRKSPCHGVDELLRPARIPVRSASWHGQQGKAQDENRDGYLPWRYGHAQKERGLSCLIFIGHGLELINPV